MTRCASSTPTSRRVSRRRTDRRSRYLASLAAGGGMPEKAHGRYLLSGGMLKCPTCGGHFEGLAPRPGKQRGVSVCSTHRRKPGRCTNRLALPMAETDEGVLSLIEKDTLGTRLIDELLALVDQGEADSSARLMADRDRLQREMSNVLGLAASGVCAETLAPKIRERERQLAQLDVELRQPRREQTDMAKLRDALLQRAAQWKTELRAEPKVARLLLRRLVGPLTLWDAADEGLRWDAPVTLGLLEGLVPATSLHLGTSPRGANSRKLVAKNAIYLAVSQALAMPLPVLTNSISAHNLGASAFGYAYLATTMCSFGFLAVGWGQDAVPARADRAQPPTRWPMPRNAATTNGAFRRRGFP